MHMTELDAAALTLRTLPEPVRRLRTDIHAPRVRTGTPPAGGLALDVRGVANTGLGRPGAGGRRRACEALERVGLADRAGAWPAVLSGGQRQRVALARALVHRPRLLLLDEPLGALDALTRIEMQRLIESLWRRHRFTALLVTHDVSEAIALADRVVLIEDHRIALDERVALGRPRSRGQAAFAALEDRVLQRVLGAPDRLEHEATQR